MTRLVFTLSTLHPAMMCATLHCPSCLLDGVREVMSEPTASQGKCLFTWHQFMDETHGGLFFASCHHVYHTRLSIMFAAWSSGSHVRAYCLTGGMLVHMAFNTSSFPVSYLSRIFNVHVIVRTSSCRSSSTSGFPTTPSSGSAKRTFASGRQEKIPMARTLISRSWRL